MTEDKRYLQPGWFMRHLFNPTVCGLTRAGVSIAGSRELRVQGRKSGQWHTTPVNLLNIDQRRYLVAPRGNTQWVRNIRVSGKGELRVGRRTDAFVAEEVTDDAKAPILREYLRRWGWEVGAFFEGIDKNASDDDLARIAPGFPVFLVVTDGAHG